MKMRIRTTEAQRKSEPNFVTYELGTAYHRCPCGCSSWQEVGSVNSGDMQLVTWQDIIHRKHQDVRDVLKRQWHLETTGRGSSKGGIFLFSVKGHTCPAFLESGSIERHFSYAAMAEGMLPASLCSTPEIQPENILVLHCHISFAEGTKRHGSFCFWVKYIPRLL